MVGGTSFPPHDSESEPWSNEQKAKATPKPSTKGKSKPEAALPERSRLATRSLEVSLDNADRVIEGAPHIRVFCECVGEGRAPAAARILVLRTEPTHRKVRDEWGTRQPVVSRRGAPPRGVVRVVDEIAGDDGEGELQLVRA